MTFVLSGFVVSLLVLVIARVSKGLQRAEQDAHSMIRRSSGLPYGSLVSGQR
jgi:hypothetical protein